MGEHVPQFESKEEEARFWEKTGLDQLSPDAYQAVEVERPARPLSATFAVRFDPRTVELLREVAKELHVGPTQLVRRWVLERIRIEEVAGVLADPTDAFPPHFELGLRQKILDSLMNSLPAAVEEAMQQVLERMDLEKRDLEGSER